MKLKNNPPRNEWQRLLTRPAFDSKELRQKVQAIIDDVASNGDRAIKKYSVEFDGVLIDSLITPQIEIDEAETLVSEKLKDAIRLASDNITLFHRTQGKDRSVVNILPGIQCWQKNVAIEKVGLYVPGGTAPLFSTVLMLAIPAQIAGCREIILCTPPSKSGKIDPAILYAAKVSGVTKIFKVGGAQAIGAMAYGTETVPAVFKIFGPGNQYVNCAKQLVQLDGVAIDMPAGPSEVCVIADDSANPAFVASDLISQAEHGIDSQVLLITTSPSLAEQVELNIREQLRDLPRKAVAARVLAESSIVVFNDKRSLIEMANEYASEHLIICCENASELSDQVINAGSVFIGNFSPEAAGDYASGTNHTLPTNGMARSYSGITLDSFSKSISFQRITREGLISIGDAVVQMAEAEGLQGHANAIKLRL